MLRRILLGFLVAAAAFGFWQLQTDAKEKAAEKAALEEEERFGKPFSEALVAFQQKRYVDAEALLTGLLPEVEQASPNSAREANVRHGLGAVTHLQHREREAEGHYRRAVEIRRKILGADNPDLVSSLSGLTEALRGEGRDADAVPYERELLAIYRRNPGIYRGDYPMCAYNIAVAPGERYHSEEARALFQEAVDNFEKYEGANSLHLALAANGLGDFYEWKGRYPEAESLYRRTLAIQQSQLNGDDADLGQTLQNLAVVLRDQGKNAEAASLERRSRAIFANASPTQTITATSLLTERALPLLNQGDLRGAETLYQQAIEVTEKEYGPDSPRVADELEFLGYLYRDYDGFRVEDAQTLFERTLAIREKNFGADSADAAKTVSDLALVYFFEKKADTGKSFAARALAIQEKASGPESLEVSTTLNRLGLCQRDLKEFVEAEASLKRALAIREKRLDANHRWIGISLDNLASVYLIEGQIEKAEPLLQRSRAIRGGAVATR